MIGADSPSRLVCMFLGQTLLLQTKEFFDHELILAVSSIANTATNMVVAMAGLKWNMLMNREKKNSYYTKLTLKNFTVYASLFFELNSGSWQVIM